MLVVPDKDVLVPVLDNPVPEIEQELIELPSPAANVADNVHLLLPCM